MGTWEQEDMEFKKSDTKSVKVLAVSVNETRLYYQGQWIAMEVNIGFRYIAI